MKWKITFVTLGRESRRRSGKAQTVVLDDTTELILQDHPTFPHTVEMLFEKSWNEINPRSHEIVKVVDCRSIEEEPVCQICEQPGKECDCVEGSFV